jgi:GTP cyclohydrolase I
MPIVAWTTSDPANTTIDSNGVATCINATPQAVTIRGTLRSGSLTGTATLSCK